MRIRDAILQAETVLNRANVPNGVHDTRRLLAYVLRIDPLLLQLYASQVISDTDWKTFSALVKKRSERIPLQYLEGEVSFMGLPFRVTPDVLIPRQDTEVLCEAALRLVPATASVLEIGTGSGALAVAMKKKRPDLRITAVDISRKALNVARENAKRNGVSVSFLLGDCYTPAWGRRFHMIVSNPPYISGEEMDALDPEVKKEPRLALYGGQDGLAMYRRIISDARNHLFSGGKILLEIGWKQKDPVSELLRREIGVPFAKRDDVGNWRVVGAEWERRTGDES